jgi:hypothetical protein
MKNIISAAAVLALGATFSSAFAATVTVTPTDSQGWVRSEFRDVSTGPYTSNTVGAINGTYQPAGEGGSVEMSSTDGSGKVDFSKYFTNVTFADLTSLSYDWYRSSASTAGAPLAPAIRIGYDADGNLATTADAGYLVFEPIYQVPVANPPAATDAWVTANAKNGVLWQHQLSPGADTFNGGSQVFQNLQGWMTSGQQGNGDLLSGNSLVTEINFGIGSGWSGSFSGAVDHVSIGLNDNITTYDFEPASIAAVPEPSTYGLMALGLAAVAFVARRKKA